MLENTNIFQYYLQKRPIFRQKCINLDYCKHKVLQKPHHSCCATMRLFLIIQLFLAINYIHYHYIFFCFANIISDTVIIDITLYNTVPGHSKAHCISYPSLATAHVCLLQQASHYQTRQFYHRKYSLKVCEKCKLQFCFL